MKKYLFAAIASLLSLGAGAEITMPSFFSDNMVLQQQTEVNVWGWTDSGKKVSVCGSWNHKKITVEPDEFGFWAVKIATPSYGGPYELTISDGKKLTLKNVLIGEVWLCSGQSNMEMPVKGFGGQPVIGSADVILSAKPSTLIRTCTIKRSASKVKSDKTSGSWMENTPEAVANASAAAYFFGARLYETLGIPVGLLISDWGGSKIEAWMSRQVLEEKFPGEFEFNHLDSDAELAKKGVHQMPCTLFNGQFAALLMYNVRGTIWYQGESNISKAAQYVKLQPAFIDMLRDIKGDPQMPFYFVQIAPYNYRSGNENSCLLRESQAENARLVRNAGMVVTMDIGDYNVIHPAKKKEVGDRLAYLALNKTYSVNCIDGVSPLFKSATFKDGKAIVDFIFGNEKSNLAPLNQNLESFELAGADGVFYPATAKVNKNRVQVEVVSEQVKDPKFVRYCWGNDKQASLFNTFNIPASPFRSK